MFLKFAKLWEIQNLKVDYRLPAGNQKTSNQGKSTAKTNVEAGRG
jgi:hypothetical protein